MYLKGSKPQICERDIGLYSPDDDKYYSFVITKGRDIDTVKSKSLRVIMLDHEWYFRMGWNVSEVTDHYGLVIAVKREH